MKIGEYEFTQKLQLSPNELQDCFEIIKNNLQFEGLVFHDGDEQIWKKNLLNNLKQNETFFVTIQNHSKTCGFMSLLAQEKLFLSEIQFAPAVKGSRLILAALSYLFNHKIFSTYDEIYFYINKSNIQSIKTFSHLGSEKIGEKNNSNLYLLTRKNLQNYLSKLKKIHLDN